MLFLDKAIKEGQAKPVFEKRPEWREEVSHMALEGEGIPARGDSVCKASAVSLGLVSERNSRSPLWLEPVGRTEANEVGSSKGQNR